MAASSMSDILSLNTSAKRVYIPFQHFISTSNAFSKIVSTETVCHAQLSIIKCTNL